MSPWSLHVQGDRGLDSEHHPMDSQSPRHYSMANGDNDLNEEESYSNQVREASHRTLR